MKNIENHHAALCSMLLALFFLICLPGCGARMKRLTITDLPGTFKAGEIISAKTGETLSFEELMSDLNRVRIIYIGERHNDPVHHTVQLKLIKALYKKHHNIAVGMEAFDRSYRKILDQWTAGGMDEQSFIEKTHWYANWRFDFKLYSGILQFLKEKHIKLVGINIPFHIPPKIAVGGIENLSDFEKKYLPKKIDTSNTAHREYVKKIFSHHHIKGIENFENFYAAQCVWEDAMAEAVAGSLEDDIMVVVVGNGHIKKKFGVPNRAFERTRLKHIQAPFRTIFLAPAGSKVKLTFADYIWVTGKGTGRK
ncbi:MAG: ChaN family lipoprotein [Deltaproteobacteria bacterium]|nr:ChaN family lipoprotein [Deltaproteobacteria bacterium]